jgi:hypothetical protein
MEGRGGGGEALMVLRPFYRWRPCGDGEGKWGGWQGAPRDSMRWWRGAGSNRWATSRPTAAQLRHARVARAAT